MQGFFQKTFPGLLNASALLKALCDPPGILIRILIRTGADLPYKLQIGSQIFSHPFRIAARLLLAQDPGNEKQLIP